MTTNHLSQTKEKPGKSKMGKQNGKSRTEKAKRGNPENYANRIGGQLDSGQSSVIK
jgi:hypothetical protein